MAMTRLCAEDDLVPLSALQHFMYCPRQCALIHLEQVWEENRATVEGKLLHSKTDSGGSEKRGDVKRVFALPIRSLRVGITGKADVVEFHRQVDDRWIPYPVEHKRGRRKKEDWDRVQVCAQALCLEEMLGVEVPEGSLYYGAERRREVVPMSPELRRVVEDTAAAVRNMFETGKTPPAEYGPKCDGCSLLDKCLPEGVGQGAGRVERYLARMLKKGDS